MKLGDRDRGGMYMGKMGSICHFPRALPASIWGHCSQILFLLAFGAHKKGCDSDTFRAVFPSIWVSWGPQTLQNKGKRKMTNRPCFTPPQGGDGVKTYRTLEGGRELKVAPRRLGLLHPKLAIFYRISVERGQFQLTVCKLGAL